LINPTENGGWGEIDFAYASSPLGLLASWSKVISHRHPDSEKSKPTGWWAWISGGGDEIISAIASLQTLSSRGAMLAFTKLFGELRSHLIISFSTY
jgi:hypothetical protein